jgi:hypothetical protein
MQRLQCVMEHLAPPATASVAHSAQPLFAGQVAVVTGSGQGGVSR